MKNISISSIVLVATSLSGIGCGTDPGKSAVTNNSNQTPAAVYANTSGTPAAAGTGSVGKDIATDAISPGSPAGTVKRFHDLAGKGDADGMTKLFSTKATQPAAKVKENNESFAKVAKAIVAGTPNATIFRVNETVDKDTAVVRFIYGNPAAGAGRGRGSSALRGQFGRQRNGARGPW